jgi:hypothetical protein
MPVRSPLTEAAIVIHNDLCVLTNANNNGLIGRKGYSIGRFRMQDVFSGRERDSEMTSSIGLELHDRSTARAVDR